MKQMHFYGLGHDQSVFYKDEKELYLPTATPYPKKKKNQDLSQESEEPKWSWRTFSFPLWDTFWPSKESKPPVTKWEERTPGRKERHTRRKCKAVSYLFGISGVKQEAMFCKAYVCYFEMHGAYKLDFFSTYWFLCLRSLNACGN